MGYSNSATRPSGKTHVGRHNVWVEGDGVWVVDNGKSRLTLIPHGLPNHLVASGLGVGEIRGRVVLGDLGIVLLGVAAQLVERLGLHGGLDAGQVDGGHWVHGGDPAAEGDAVLVVVVAGDGGARCSFGRAF